MLSTLSCSSVNPRRLSFQSYFHHIIKVPAVTLYCLADALALRFAGIARDEVKHVLDDAIEQEEKLSEVSEHSQLLILFFNGMT